jgi:hypothetical protein
VPEPSARLEILGGGALAGLVGALVMIGALALLPGSLGVVDAGRGVAATWLGLGALLGGPEVVLLGLLTQVVVAVAWGVVFSLFVRDDTDTVVAVAIGLVWGAASWLIMVWGVLAAADPVLYARVALDPWPWLVAHLLFGATLGATPWAERAVARWRLARRPKPVLVLHTFRRR